MRTFAIGDIHGCLVALNALLGAINIRPNDTVVTLGNYVDWGPDSPGVIERLMRLHRREVLVPLRGNHDQMMLEARCGGAHLDLWLRCGGRQTLSGYSMFDDAGRLADVPDDHWEFLDRFCQDYHEGRDHFFVHANACHFLDLEDQPLRFLMWEKLGWSRPHKSGKVMICGHTRQSSGVPLNRGHAICIDTGPTHAGGWLTALEVESGRLWQANQRGEVRTSRVEEHLVVEADD